MKITRLFPCILPALFGLMLASCAVVNSPDGQALNRDPSQPVYFLVSPGDRQAAPDRYFTAEYQQINARRGSTNLNVRPDHLLGLAMSGGGIRSAAFQLGILSGLHAALTNGQQILTKVDYISSVSGGSWANGAYWGTTNTDDDFFKLLDAYASSGTKSPYWQTAARILRNEQCVEYFDLTTQRKERWQDDIRQAYCGDGDIDLAQHLTDSRYAKTKDRPYPIFNSTHSYEGCEEARLGTYPFQTTPDYVGTIIDSTNKGCSGFFLNISNTNACWANDKWLWFPDRPGTTLSLALAQSSGVIGGMPFLLQYTMKASCDGKPVPGLRKEYNLDDGGKSDNLGLLPLLERGVNTIIVSQMGMDDNLEDLPFSRDQARVYFHANLDDSFNPLTVPLVHNESYQCGHKGGARQGRLILIRPTPRNVREFLRNMELTNTPMFKEFFNEEKKKEKHVFPMTETMKQEYSPILVRSYYLLGKYIAENLVPKALLGQMDGK